MQVQVELDGSRIQTPPGQRNTQVYDNGRKDYTPLIVPPFTTQTNTQTYLRS